VAIPAPAYTVDGLVASVLNKYIIPNSQSTFTNQNIVDLLDEEMRSTIIPVINSVHEEYWVHFVDSPILQNVNVYDIPQRCVAGILRDVVFVDNNGNELNVSQLSPVQIKSGFPYGPPLPVYGFGYYMQDDQIVLYPPQRSAATAFKLRIKFFRRPNNLTLTSNCGQIIAINGNVLTLSFVSSEWTTTTTFDIIQSNPQFRSMSDSTAVTLIAGNNVTLSMSAADVVANGIAVGMWFCPTTMTCIPQIPYEAFPLLVQRGIMRVAESYMDTAGVQAAEKRYVEMKDNVVKLIEPRVQGGTKTVINPDSKVRFRGYWGSPGVR
jgi:hypothetical protein